MSERDERDERKGSPLLGCLIAVVMTLPAYVLSIGPAIWLAKRGYLPQEIGIIYAPLALLAWFGPIKRLFEWYFSFWQ